MAQQYVVDLIQYLLIKGHRENVNELLVLCSGTVMKIRMTNLVTKNIAFVIKVSYLENSLIEK